MSYTQRVLSVQPAASHRPSGEKAKQLASGRGTPGETEDMCRIAVQERISTRHTHPLLKSTATSTPEALKREIPPPLPPAADSGAQALGRRDEMSHNIKQQSCEMDVEAQQQHAHEAVGRAYTRIDHQLILTLWHLDGEKKTERAGA